MKKCCSTHECLTVLTRILANHKKKNIEAYKTNSKRSNKIVKNDRLYLILLQYKVKTI
jgi:hypothetical protein